ncbi:TadE-like protein [Aliiroseovarius halocynthiae]|nr:TadE-like protein [Aliiroseovarius halocynthiae]
MRRYRHLARRRLRLCVDAFSMKREWSELRDFRRSTRGSSTIEFVIWFPLYLTLFLMSFELTYFGFRTVLLDRAIDLQVRGLRLGTVRPSEVDDLKKTICEKGLIFDDCEKSLTIEMRRIDQVAWSMPTVSRVCVDRNDDFKPPEDVEYGPGGAGDLLLLRACLVADPFFQTTPWILGLPLDPSGGVAISATTTFVNEP